MISCIETYIDSEKNYYGCFLIEPLDTGQAITLGNAIRRTLLSDLTSYAITGVRINDLKHEFSSLEGVREDVLEILFNLKEIIFKNTFFSNKKFQKKKKHVQPLKAFIAVKGPVIVTAGMFHLPKKILKIINPNQYICTLVDDSDFFLEIDIERGRGYLLGEEKRKKKREELFELTEPSTLLIDTLYNPIKKVNYKVKLIYDIYGNIKESLCFEITTNGSLTPKRSIQEANKILLNLFYTLFLTPSFLNLSTSFSKKT